MLGKQRGTLHSHRTGIPFSVQSAITACSSNERSTGKWVSSDAEHSRGMLLGGFPSYVEHLCIYCNVLGFSTHDGTLLHSKSQYTTVKHSRKLFEHTYTSDLYGLETLTPREFFQQDLLWQSSITHFHSYNQKASKHKSGQSIVGLSVLLHTTTALRRILHH
jgi:hypothetical protein